MTKNRSDMERAILGETAIDQWMRDDRLSRMTGDLGLASRPPDVLALMGAARPPVLDLHTVRTATEAHKALTEMAKPFGGVAEMARGFTYQRRQFQDLMDAAGGSAVLDLARAQHWASALAGPSITDLTALTPNFSRIMTEVAAIRE